jgi:hypothetical protein
VVLNRCSLNGGVTVNADPPPVPGVIVNVVEDVNRADRSLLTRVWSIMAIYVA